MGDGPSQLTASLLAFFARDALVGTGFGLFTGVWLAFGLAGLSAGVSSTSHVLGALHPLRALRDHRDEGR